MNKGNYERFFSTARLQGYFSTHSQTELAIEHYLLNIKLSESLYPVLALYEVYLRNSIDRQLVHHFRRQDWYTTFSSDPTLSPLDSKVNAAINYIVRRGEIATKDKIIAELTMGFWVTLFNARYERILWKPLRKVFPNLSRAERQRRTVSSSLNKIRDFRNRIFHHEAISWHSIQLEEQHLRIMKTMQ